MNCFVGQGFGRILVINLQREELILESIQKKLEELGILYGVVMCGIGTFENASFHRVTDLNEKPNEEFIALQRPFEASCLQGVIMNGEPHIHFVIADKENSYAAHLESGSTTLYAMEIVIAEIMGIEGVVRKKDDKGIPAFYKY